jgi:hypothetical protein
VIIGSRPNTYLGFLVSAKLREYSRHRLALGISYCTQPIPGDSTDHKTGQVSDDETEACATNRAEPSPPGYMSFYLWAEKLRSQLLSYSTPHEDISCVAHLVKDISENALRIRVCGIWARCSGRSARIPEHACELRKEIGGRIGVPTSRRP